VGERIALLDQALDDARLTAGLVGFTRRLSSLHVGDKKMSEREVEKLSIVAQQHGLFRTGQTTTPPRPQNSG
jgi:hypothetical protein